MKVKTQEIYSKGEKQKKEVIIDGVGSKRSKCSSEDYIML